MRRFTVESYHEPTTGYGPYWKVVGPDGRTAGELVEGVAYPLDGIITRAKAQRRADALNSGSAQ